MVTGIERIMECVYMEALAHPSTEDDEDGKCPMVKNQLLPGLRSFCSALKGLTLITQISYLLYRSFWFLLENSRYFVSVCEEVCDEVNIFDDGKILTRNLEGPESIKALAKKPDEVAVLEERVSLWIKRVMEVSYNVKRVSK